MGFMDEMLPCGRPGVPRSRSLLSDSISVVGQLEGGLGGATLARQDLAAVAGAIVAVEVRVVEDRRPDRVP